MCSVQACSRPATARNRNKVVFRIGMTGIDIDVLAAIVPCAWRLNIMVRDIVTGADNRNFFVRATGTIPSCPADRSRVRISIARPTLASAHMRRASPGFA